MNLKALSLITLVFISCFSTTAAAVTPGVSVQDGEDWSLPSWITGWSPYGGIYLIWSFGVKVPYSNPNYDVRRTSEWPPTSWAQIHTGEGTFTWTVLDNYIAQLDAVEKNSFSGLHMVLLAQHPKSLSG